MDEHERRVALEGQINFRDLGGYAVEDGRRVRWRALFRSGDLVKLTDADREKVGSLGLRAVIDLRSDTEIGAFGATYVPAGARALPIPVGGKDLHGSILPALVSGDFSALPPNLLTRVNRGFVREGSDAFAALMRIVSDPDNRPLVFHCTQGKDRTGFGAALILSALGVAWEDVVADYLLSNRYRSENNERYLEMIAANVAQRSGIPVEEVDLGVVRPLFFVEAAALEAAREEIVTRYGTLEAYMDEALGFGADRRARLRDELLEPA